MAKKKLNDYVKEALLVIDKSLYAVPDNWIWTNLSNFANKIQYGYTSKSNMNGQGVKYLRITDIQNGIVDWSKVPNCEISEKDFEKFKLNEGDIVVARTGATTGKNHLISNVEINSVFASYLIRISPIEPINAKYLSWFMKSNNYWQQISEVKNGIAQPGANAKKIGRLNIPMAPLKEQQRIVNRIESFFEKIDKAQKLIEEARDGFEKRKEAILAKAFRGELTTKWREENNSSSPVLSIEKALKYPSTWKLKKLCDIAELKSGYAFKSKEFVDEGIQLIRMGNLYGSKLDLNRNPVYLPEGFDERIIRKYSVKNGDILLTLTGTKYKRDYGYAIKIESNDKLLLNQRIMSIRSKTSNDYILYYLLSGQFRDDFFANETGGVNQGNVSSKYVSNIEIPVPPYQERVEICSILNKLLSENRKAQVISDCLEQIELLKKSILSKAFRGELGTNDPKEESSLKLLRQILSEKNL